MLGMHYIVRVLAGGELSVVAPPYLEMSLPPFFVALISTIFFCYRAFKARSLFPLIGVVIFAFPSYFAAYLAGRGGSLTLDRTTNIAVLIQPSLMGHKQERLRMTDIQYAQIRSGRSSTWIALVMKDGSSESFSDSTDQGGKGEAVQAINDYLGVRMR